MITIINEMASGLTPREFQTVFPIEKSYDEEKWGTIDYFYTKKYIEEFGEDKVIGDTITEFLWDYHNWELTDFASQALCVMSAIRRAEGSKRIAEEFCEDHSITTYTMTEGDNGKQILVNNYTGEISKVNKPKPRHLRVVK